MSAHSAPRVLLIEDSMADAALVAALLGNRVSLEHVTALEQVDPIPAEPYDCLLLDLSLPGSTGLDSLSTALERFDVPVVVLTGLHSEKVAATALQLGAQDYLPKNELEPKLLERTIRFAIQRGQWIRERDELRESLDQQRRHEGLGVLAGGLAHDFNNLIMTIRGFAELACGKAEAAKEELDYVIQAADQAAELTSAMLAYAGRRQRRPQPLDVRVLAEELYNLYHSSALEEGIELSLELDEQPCVVHCDGKQLREALLHVFTNALEAIKRNGSPGSVVVRVALAQEPGLQAAGLALGDPPSGRLVRVEVQDTGCGIAPENLAQVCDPFVSVRFDGRGLGLAVVQGVVRSHKGSMRVQSQVGQGTHVELCLPFCDQSVPERSSGVGHFAPRGKGELVLVVDDELPVLRTVEGLVELAGYSARGFQDRAAALDAVAADPSQFQAVIMDLTMPGQVDAKRALDRFAELNPELPVILSSGYDRDDVLQRVEGVRSFVKKPYSADELSDALATAIRR